MEGLEFVQHSGGYCRVCGAEGATCKGPSPSPDTIHFAPPAPPNPLATFRVPHRIYEETKVGRRLVKRLLYPAGATITPAEAKRLGFIPDDQKLKKNPNWMKSIHKTGESEGP